MCVLCAAIGLAPLVALVYYTAERGLPGLSLDFLTHAPVPEGVPGGGISTAIVGSAEIVGLAIVMSVPVGLMAALFLHERRGYLAGAVRFGADLLTGVPSIVIGIFAYAVLVRPLHHFSDLAGGVRVGRAYVADNDQGGRGGHAHRRGRPVGGGRGSRCAPFPGRRDRWCCEDRSLGW